MSILLLESLHEEAETLLANYASLTLAGHPEHSADLQHVEAILTRGQGRISAELMAGCPQLRVVARCGVGLDNIDLAAAEARGIAVVYAPGATTTAVAEHTFMLILAATRKLRPVLQAVHQGDWNIRNQYRGSELANQTIGIIGFGQIGQRVASLAEAFGMQVVTYSRKSTGRYPSLQLYELLRLANIVSLHVALTKETFHLIDSNALAQMKPDALLINTARGAVIDQQALKIALAHGRIGGFASDVLEQEPPSDGEALLQDARVLVTPHIAALTDATYRAICVETAKNVLALLRGEQADPASLFHK